MDVWQTGPTGGYDVWDERQPEYNFRGRINAPSEDGATSSRRCCPSRTRCRPTGPVGRYLEAVGQHPWRPAHIHFKVTAPGHRTLVTQVFFPDDPYLENDTIGAVKPALVRPVEKEDDHLDVRLRHRAGTGLSFDNLGEVTALARGEWPAGAPLGEHCSVTRALPRVLDALDEAGLRATFFVEGLNAELYPDTLRELDARGPRGRAATAGATSRWAGLDAAAERELLERGVERFERSGCSRVGFRPPGGELTAAIAGLLRELGFTYCSPARATPADARGIALAPVPLGARRRLLLPAGFDGPPSAAALREAMFSALESDHATLIFHPFLTGTDERFAVLREVLERARDARPLRESNCGWVGRPGSISCSHPRRRSRAGAR